MPVPGHRQSPPDKGKTKAAVTIKLLRQFSRTPHSVLAKRQWQRKPWELRFFTSKVQRRTENLFLWKITYGKVSKQVFWLTFSSEINKPSQFPNDRLSPLFISWMHTATGIVADSHRVPFSPTVPFSAVRTTLCVDIKLYGYYSTDFYMFQYIKQIYFYKKRLGCCSKSLLNFHNLWNFLKPHRFNRIKSYVPLNH